MLKGGDLDLNSIHFCTDSLKERLKQTMVNQELVLMRQVVELHRLYSIQIAMTEDFKQNGLDDYNLHKGSMNLIPVNLNNQAKGSMADFLKSKNFNLQQSRGFMQRPLDLHLSADEFIHQSTNDFSGKGVLGGSMEVLTVSKKYFQDKVEFDLHNFNLSLSIGQNACQKGAEHRSWLRKRPCASSADIIDLEDPNFSGSNNFAYLGLTSKFAASKTLSRDKHKLESFLESDKNKLEGSSQSGIRHISYGTTLSNSRVDVGPSCQRQTLHDSELNGRCGDFMPAGLMSNKKMSAPREANNFDLNTVQLEDLSYLSNNPSAVVNPLGTSMSAVSQKNDVKIDFAQRFIDSVGENCSKHRKSGEGSGGKIIYIDLDSDSGEELCSSRSDPKIESVGSSSKLSNGLSCEIDMVDAVGAKANLEKDSKPFVDSHFCQNQTPAEQLNRHKLSSPSESESMIDQHSSSIKTMQSGVKGGDLNFYSSDESQMVGPGPAAAHSGEQDQRSSESPESEAEVDGTVRTAAELLVHISSETRASYLGGLAKVDLKELQNIEDDQPQCSSESYEAMVLQAKESGPDDYCISSNAFAVDVSENKDCKYKLKRGTRMKDFQKDILPGLSTLARHEIREDINIIEGVIRSREYKKMRAKMADGGSGDWCRSTRSKRSRVSRRNYL